MIALPKDVDLWRDTARRKKAVLDAYTLGKEVEEVCQSLTRSIRKIYKVDGKLYCTLLPLA